MYVMCIFTFVMCMCCMLSQLVHLCYAYCLTQILINNKPGCIYDIVFLNVNDICASDAHVCLSNACDAQQYASHTHTLAHP